VAAALALTACAGVPDSGAPVPVRRVPPAGTVQDEPDVRVQPRGPVPGSTPEQVVRGFLDAMVSAEDDHAIGRSFLTPEAGRTWADDSGVRVFELDTVAEVRPGLVRVTGEQHGVLAVNGSFTPSRSPVSIQLRLREVAGSWRVDNPPAGVLLRDVYFTQLYTAYAVYFGAPGTAPRLVPDLRYVERSIVTARRNTLVRLLLGGPSAWLAPAVRTGFPAGTQLRGNVVEDGQVVVVDLTTEAEIAAPADRTLMAAQLVATLRQLPVIGVRILLEGQQFEVPGASDVQDTAAWSRFDLSLTLVRA